MAARSAWASIWPPHLAGEGARPLEDRDAARLGVRLDVGVAQLREVVVRPRHRELAVREHAVPDGAVARGARRRARAARPSRRRARRRRARAARRRARLRPSASSSGTSRAADDSSAGSRRAPPPPPGRESSCGRRRSCRAGESTTTRSATSTFCAFANPTAAFVACRPCRTRSPPGGPRTSASTVLLPLGKPRGARAPAAGASRTTRRPRARARFRQRFARGAGELQPRRQERRRRDLLRPDFQQEIVGVHLDCLLGRRPRRAAFATRAPLSLSAAIPPPAPARTPETAVLPFPKRRPARRRRRGRESAG